MPESSSARAARPAVKDALTIAGGDFAGPTAPAIAKPSWWHAEQQWRRRRLDLGLVRLDLGLAQTHTVDATRNVRPRMSEGEQGEHEGEATALWSILLGALHNDRRKRQPEMLVPPTENMAAAEAIKANETVETEAVSARWLSWAERRSEWTVRRPLARRPAHPLPLHLPAAEQVYKTLKARGRARPRDLHRGGHSSQAGVDRRIQEAAGGTQGGELDLQR